MGSVLPAVLYSFRWGLRRGKGQFVKTFGRNNEAPNVESIAEALERQGTVLQGFEGDTGQAILGDLLLTFCIENRNHKTGQREPVQRVYPTHYMSSWIDLPLFVAHLRGIPELLVALLSEQATEEFIQPMQQQKWFGVSKNFEDNILLNLFSQGMLVSSQASGLSSDVFNETTNEDLGIDQLLTIRLAQHCGSASPSATRGDGGRSIYNRRPISKRANDVLREDLKVIVKMYGESIPRQTLLPMLESCLSLGLSNIFCSTAKILTTWETKGIVTERHKQVPWSFSLDCSTGTDGKLRAFAEESAADFMRKFSRVPVVMMMLRILDDRARVNRKLRDSLPNEFPDATDLINLLGDILHKRDVARASGSIIERLDEWCEELAQTLSDADERHDVQHSLRTDTNAVARLAEGLCLLMGDKLQIQSFVSALDSCLMTEQPNGLAKKRRATRINMAGRRVTEDARSFVLTNTMLDFLVHRHLYKASNFSEFSLTLGEFIEVLRERYGLHVDREPEGMSIPTEMLARNRQLLERRLRDLGLLIGVNDAESMKYLRGRFAPVEPEVTHA